MVDADVNGTDRHTEETRATLAQIADLHRQLADQYKRLAEQQSEPATPQEPERLLSADEIAPMLSTTVDHVWAMMRRGTLPTIYVGKKYRRVPLSALRAYMSGQAFPAIQTQRPSKKRTPRIGRLGAA